MIGKKRKQVGACVRLFMLPKRSDNLKVEVLPGLEACHLKGKKIFLVLTQVALPRCVMEVEKGFWS